MKKKSKESAAYANERRRPTTQNKFSIRYEIMTFRNQIRTIVKRVGPHTFQLNNGFTINVRNILRKVSPTEFVTFPTASQALSTNTSPTGANNIYSSRLPSVPGSGSVSFTLNSDIKVVNLITDSFNALTRRSKRN